MREIEVKVDIDVAAICVKILHGELARERTIRSLAILGVSLPDTVTDDALDEVGDLLGMAPLEGQTGGQRDWLLDAWGDVIDAEDDGGNASVSGFVDLMLQAARENSALRTDR